MKLYRNAIILLVVLGLLVGAYAFITHRKAKTADSTQPSSADNSTLYVTQLDKDKVTEMTMEGATGKFTLVRGGKDNKEWVLSPSGSLKIVNDKADSLVGGCASVLADKVIEEKASDLSQ